MTGIFKITEQELPEIHALCDRVNEQIRFDEMGYPYSHEAMVNGWARTINDANHISFCHKTKGTVDGIFLCRVQNSSYFMKDYLVAYEIAFHADPALSRVAASRITLAIRKEAEQCMKSRGVKSFFISTHPQQVGGMDSNMEKRGYRCISRYYVKEL